jgi:predicted SAM-dependent methyltransferase
MAFKKSLFDEIGEFDESLWPCSGEEIDFCLKARAAGHKIGIAQDVYVHHEGSKTFQAMESAGQIEYAQIVERNDKHLAEKWGDFWQKQIVREFVNTDGTYLNLGCGRFPMPGFINIDQYEEVKPDVVADVTKLPYGPGTVDEIYCGHLLEHLDWKEGEAALNHWLNVLKSGGAISICVPDFDVLAKKHIENPTAAAMRQMNDLYVYSYQQKSPHKYMYNGALLKSAMENAGFIEVERMPRNHPYFVDPVEWQVGYTGTKP